MSTSTGDNAAGAAARTPFDSRQRRRGFLLDAAQLGSGTALAQGLMMLSMPLLSRLFNPDEFGIAAVYLSLVTLVSVASGLRYELAILLPEDEHDAADLFRLHLALTVIVSAAVGLLLWALRESVAEWLNSPPLAGYLWLAGPGVLLYGALNGLNTWHTRMKRFRLLATTRVAGSAGMVIAQLAAGVMSFANAGGLIIGGLLGRSVEDGIQAWHLLRDSRREGWRPIRWANLAALARRHRKFPLYNSWAALINSLSWQAPAFMLAMFFSPTVVGWYAVGDRVIRTPMNTFGRAVGQVFLQRGVDSHRQGELGRLFLETLRILARLGLAPLLVLTFSGQAIFSLALGAQWTEAGIYVQLLGPWAFIWFVSAPVATIMVITEQQEKSLLFNILILVTRVASLLVGGLSHDPRLALVLFSATGILSYGWVLLWVGQAAGVPWRRTLAALIGPDAWAGAVIAAVLVAIQILPTPLLAEVAADVVLLLAYYAYLLRRHRHLLPQGAAPASTQNGVMGGDAP